MSKPRKLPSGRWQAYLNVTEGGVRKQVALGTFATQRDAKDAISVAEAERKRGTFVAPAAQRVTVGEWAEQWYALRRAPSRKVRSVLDARIIPYWKDWHLGDVEEMHVQQWVNSLTADGLAPETVRNYYAVLKQMFGKAVKWRKIPFNPCDLDSSGLPAQRKSTKIFLTVEECNALLTLAPDRYRAMIHLALASGLRIGELITLHWTQVDIEGAAVTVLKQYAKNKTERTVWISLADVEVLRAHRRDFGGSDMVFTTDAGKPVDYDNFRRRVWGPLVREALPAERRATFHCLRHTALSRMLNEGVDARVVSEQAGHHKASFTIDVYGKTRHDAEAHFRKVMEGR